MSQNKTTKFKLPIASVEKVKTIKLPYNGKIVESQGFSISFSAFDRTHKLFNLGGTNSDGTVGGSWFIELLDCLKNVNGLTIPELKSSTFDFHPIDWKNANAIPPLKDPQYEYWQFRINKSKGRVIGIPIDNIFYIVWLDPHHNLTDSEGYGTAICYKPAMSLCEKQQYRIDELVTENQDLRNQVKELEDLINRT